MPQAAGGAKEASHLSLQPPHIVQVPVPHSRADQSPGPPRSVLPQSPSLDSIDLIYGEVVVTWRTRPKACDMPPTFRLRLDEGCAFGRIASIGAADF